MQLEGWKCLECGVVYAPFVTECRCSAKMSTNDVHLVCIHEWPEPYAPCTKCGVRMEGISFTVPPNVPVVDISGCVHIYPDSSLTTAGRFCSLCGSQEVLWEKTGNTTVPQGGTING